MKKGVIIGFVVITLVLLISLTQITFFVVQPIGAIPSGITLVIPRGQGTKLFDSADAMCLREFNSVSLFCRGAAISAIMDNSNIIFRLPYIDFIYAKSTGGVRFEK